MADKTTTTTAKTAEWKAKALGPVLFTILGAFLHAQYTSSESERVRDTIQGYVEAVSAVPASASPTTTAAPGK